MASTDSPDPLAATTPAPEQNPPAASRSRLALILTLGAAVLLVDQLVKVWVVATVSPSEPKRILGGLVYLSLLRNPGAAFSIATGLTWVLALIAIIVVVVLIRLGSKIHATSWAITFGIVLGGALGNLMDRFFRSPGFMRGHVVDFVSVFGPNAKYFPVFNVADAALNVGVVLIIVLAILGIDFDGHRAKKGRRAAAATESADSSASADV